MSLVQTQAQKVRLMVIGAGVAVLVVGYVALSAMFLTPRRELADRISTTQASILQLQEELDAQVELLSEQHALAARTLAAEADVATARLRDGLSRVGEMAGLSGVTVSHGRPIGVSNPLLQARGISTTLKRRLRAEKDFDSIRASLSGRGTLEQVLECLAMAQSQTWIHRVEGFELKPAAGAKENETRFDLRIDVITLLAPTMMARGKDGKLIDPEITLMPAPASAEQIWRPIAQKNAFRRPSEEKPDGGGGAKPVQVAQQPSTDSTPPAPQPFAPYEDWKLTGIVEGGRGAEAFFINSRTGERVTVLRGARILDAVFVEGSGESGIFELGGNRFEVRNGQTLASRRPLSKVD
jgi:hypothetical protein